MNVPIAVGKYLTKCGYYIQQERWKSMGKNMAYAYFIRRCKGYLITVYGESNNYLVEVLQHRRAFNYNTQERKIKKLII